MAIEFGPDFLPGWAGRPPGLSPLDLAIWRNWHPENYPAYLKFNFNVRLIRPSTLPPSTPPDMIQMWLANTAKRVDVLGWKPNQIDIIELRDSAGLSAVGHVLGYYRFLLLEIQDQRQLRPLLITNRPDQDVIDLAEFTGVTIEVI